MKFFSVRIGPRGGAPIHYYLHVKDAETARDMTERYAERYGWVIDSLEEIDEVPPPFEPITILDD